MSETISLVKVSEPGKRFHIFATDATEIYPGIEELLFSFNTRKDLMKQIEDYTKEDDVECWQYWQIFDTKTGFATKCQCDISNLPEMLTVLENEDI